MLDVTRMLTAQIILHVKIDNVSIPVLSGIHVLQVLYVKSSGMNLYVHALMVTLGIHKLAANCVSSNEGIINLNAVRRSKNTVKYSFRMYRAQYFVL